MLKHSLPFILGAGLLSMSPISHADISSSFSKAKSKLYKNVYSNSGTTFYAGCSWSKKKVDLESCHLQNSFPTSQNKRSKRIEAEHIIPSSWMYKVNGKTRNCVNEAKRLDENIRKYCQQNDQSFRDAHNDLVNLRPAVGAINGYRSNKPFGETISGKKQTTYRTPFSTTIITSRLIIPDPKIRGDIARIAFHMKRVHGVTYSKRQQSLFEKWDKEDPISQEEIRLNAKIIQAQGLGNGLL